MAQLQQRNTMHMQQQALRASSRIGRSVRTVQVFASSSNGGQKPVMLEVTDLQAKIVETGQQILNGVSLCVREGEVHAIMGKNGSGKSTLSKVLVGHPDYEVTGGSATYKGKNLFDLEPEERSHEGLFLSFQSPIEIPGVSNVDFLRMACNARRKSLGQTELDPLEFYAFVIPKVGSQAWQEISFTAIVFASCCRLVVGLCRIVC
jgi:Fe-S cluster assembly ATP-binding protein